MWPDTIYYLYVNNSIALSTLKSATSLNETTQLVGVNNLRQWDVLELKVFHTETGDEDITATISVTKLS